MTSTLSENPGYVVDDVSLGVTVSARGTRLDLLIDVAEPAAVRRAADDLARDLVRVCGAVVEVTTGTDVGSSNVTSPRIVVGTIGSSAAVDAAIEAGLLDIAPLRDESGALRWEGSLVALVDQTLYLAGTDRRGVVYAIYDLARAIGVSPWYWWGDVPVRTREHVTIATGTSVADWPSVRYRGIFLNDEEELFHWARTHTSDGTIGPETYARVYELLLRLKANYLWPAMHVGAFNHDSENGRLAHEMGIVIGSSHCDMLLRSNEHEFRPWVGSQGEDIAYDYSLPGHNRQKLQEYWQGSVEQNRDFEVTWTVGMRGVHDTGFVTAAIDADDELDESERLAARVALLESVIADQRALLSSTLRTDASSPPQLFIPYKEVLTLYDAGLEVPDDVTLVWANDNFGHVRRFPDEVEKQRSGGHGLYYHSSYWSNYTTSYLATSSTPLALMRSELSKAWERGIRRLWVNNVGGLKPLELETEMFLRSAWEAGKETTTADPVAFTGRWVDETFSGGHGGVAGRVYAEYYQLNNQRKYEHLSADVFSQTAGGDEAGRRLAAFRVLYEETNDILRALPEEERDPFFQLFAVKIHMAYLVNGQFVHADRSALAHRQGKAAAADEHLMISRAFERSTRTLVHFYNRVMSGGRWDGMFTPEEFPPPVMPLYPAGAPALRIEGRGLGAVIWGETERATSDSHLVFWPDGISHKWVELFSTGLRGTKFIIDCDPWIEVEPNSGTVDAETRVQVRIVGAGAHAGHQGTVVVSAPETGETIELIVRVAAASKLPSGFVGSIEAEGVVSIDPALPDKTTDGTDSSWVTVPSLGRFSNAAVQARPVPPGSSAPFENGATLEFGMHLRTAGAHRLEMHRLPTLDSTRRIRVAVSVDDHAPIVLESPTTDEHRGSWAHAVQDNVERLSVRLPHLEEGPHVLRLHAVDPYVTLSKLVVHTGKSRSGNLGPQFSAHTARPLRADPDPEATVDVDALDRAARELYRTDPDAVPLPKQIYAGRDFWDGDTTFRRPLAVPQIRRAPGHNLVDADGRKDVVASLGNGAIQEDGGVLAFETELVLADDRYSWRSEGDGAAAVGWTHTQSETQGRAGLAMHVHPRGHRWENPSSAPGMHVTLDVSRPGTYRVWLLVKFQDGSDDSCTIALDGVHQAVTQQFSLGDPCAYGLRQAWLWMQLSDLDIATGRHTFSLHARKSGLRVDRIYLTLGDELPPVDADWKPSTLSSAADTAVPANLTTASRP